MSSEDLIKPVLEVEIVDEQDQENIDDREEAREEETYDFFDKMDEIRKTMKKYIDSKGLPLCEYLETGILFDFVTGK